MDATRWSEIGRLVGHYYGPEADATKLQALRRAPRDVVRHDAGRLGLSLGGEDLDRTADLLSEMAAVSTGLSLEDRARVRKRIESALERMTVVFELRRGLYGLVFGLGLTAAWLGLYQALVGGWREALVLGGIGATHLAISMARQAIRGVRESSSDLIQLRVAYGAFFAEIDQWQHHHAAGDSEAALADKRAVAQQLRRTVRHAVELIERYCKPAEARVPSPSEEAPPQPGSGA